jgi:Tfp pilus assembly protein PilF
MSTARPLTPLAVVALALVVSACAGISPRPPAAPAAALALPPAERLSRAVGLLDHGQPVAARAELAAMLAARPDDARASRLMREIDQDPRILLGSRSYAYTVRPGETMSALAERFLGDSLMFYALARYNGMAAPADLTAGRVLMIPGLPHRAAASAPPPPQAPQQQPVKPPPVRDHAQARLLRASALESMNRGQINRAVNLLRHAAEVDPDDPLIARDLTRALRIQATVHGR